MVSINDIISDEDALFEMSNIRKAFSGLPVNIFISSGGSVNKKHSPRIKVMTNTGDKFDVYSTVSIMLKRDISQDDVVGYEVLPPKILNAIREYVNLNYDALMDHWNDVLSSDEVLLKLKRIS